jgi:hypothetical protein
MRTLTAVLAAVLLLCLAVAGTTGAAAGPTLSRSPNPVSFGQKLTIKGKRWPVNEFCKRRVKLFLTTSQNRFTIGFARVHTNGRFKRHWTPRRSRVGAGRWKLVARMRCESGDTGAPVFVRKSRRLRIR